MQIFIKTLTGYTLTIDCEEHETTLDLKRRILEKTGISIAEQALIFCGKLIPDNCLLGPLNIYREGCVHLVNKQVDQRIIEQFETEETVLLWTVNYFQHVDPVFQNHALQITASDDFATAYAAWQKRKESVANGRDVYLSLTAVLKSDLDTLYRDEAPKKYQPANGRMFSYTSSDAPITVLPLLMAIPNGNRLDIIQNTNQPIHHSQKYQLKYQQLYGAVNHAILDDLSSPKWHMVTDTINTEINFNLPDDNNFEELLTDLNAFLAQIRLTTTLPVVVGQLPTTINTLMFHLNTCRNLVGADISDQELIEHVRNIVAYRIDNPILTDERLQTLTDVPAQAATQAVVELPAIVAQASAEAPKQTSYLMFDQGGVLDGVIIENPNQIDAENDLVIEKYEWGGSQVLVNGVQIIRNLNELVNEHGYQIVFHSKNAEEDQQILLAKLKRACLDFRIRFPAVHAMGVYDRKNHPTTSSSLPVLKTDPSATVIATWGQDDLNGKASLRRALEYALDITPESRSKHVIFDDGYPNVETPISEGYQAYWISENGVTLDVAIRQVLERARNNAQSVVPMNVIRVNKGAAPHMGLPDGFMAYFAKDSQAARESKGNISADNYWYQLTPVEQTGYLNKYKDSTSTVNNPTSFFYPPNGQPNMTPKVPTSMKELPPRLDTICVSTFENLDVKFKATIDFGYCTDESSIIYGT